MIDVEKLFWRKYFFCLGVFSLEAIMKRKDLFLKPGVFPRLEQWNPR
jgi:hypothetical protein